MIGRNSRARRTGGLALLFLLLSAGPPAGAADVKYRRTTERYDVPAVTLVNQDGEKIDLRPLLLESDKPVLLDFVYSSCTTISPILSAGFSSFQEKLGGNSDGVRLVSISIDPDNDAPGVMKEYLRTYGAKPGWQFLTGSLEDIKAVILAFGAYDMRKKIHYPLTFL
ncbi:MAG TPA: SCO family protein, partial [Candidatus Aquicultoraceae bacterium]|nr:SCO family protein [Candidatus Aquicultoraceae bacterium]